MQDSRNRDTRPMRPMHPADERIFPSPSLPTRPTDFTPMKHQPVTRNKAITTTMSEEDSPVPTHPVLTTAYEDLYDDEEVDTELYMDFVTTTTSTTTTTTTTADTTTTTSTTSTTQTPTTTATESSRVRMKQRPTKPFDLFTAGSIGSGKNPPCKGSKQFCDVRDMNYPM